MTLYNIMHSPFRDVEISPHVSAAFASSVWAKSKAYRVSNASALENKALRESISVDLRKISDLLKPMVSRKAKIEATRRSLCLETLTWHRQPIVDPKRKVFHYEHVIPVSIIRDKCLEASSEETIELILSKLKVAWILKTENEELNRLGFQSNRIDPESAYLAAGIELLNPKSSGR